jgi:hypothetical protein
MKSGLTKAEKLVSDYKMTVSDWYERQTSKVGRVDGLSRWGARYAPEEGVIARALYTGKPEKIGVKWTVNGVTMTTVNGGVKLSGKVNITLQGAQKDKLASALLERPITSYQVFCSQRGRVTRDAITPTPPALKDFIDNKLALLDKGKMAQFVALKAKGAFKPSKKH